MPGWLDRAFDLAVPPAWNGGVIYALHGGGGNHLAADKITCPGGNRGDPGCLIEKAAAAGYAVVSPNGTGTRPIYNARTWNAGGGTGDWMCVSGPACKSDVDDMRYFDELHAEVQRLIQVDFRRVYVTGMSNGAAMAHRLACAWGRPLAAVAPVGGANQYAAAGGACAGGVPLLQIHGTADPCWRFEQGSASCAGLEQGQKVGVDASMEGWRVRNGCADAPPAETDLPDADPNDGMTSRRFAFSACFAAVELIRVENGGHTWPGGDQYLSADTVGGTTHDFDADDVILEFFAAHALP
jgi:polyhydroxybutyrate depolymerase